MLRRRITYSNVVATLALVFAMSGGAYAASKFLITSTKQIKPSVLASLKGKAGANGAAGAQGAAGPAGPAGGVGPQGAAGTAGTAGEPGREGKAGKNGTNGKEGKEGSPWTDKGTLPVGSTETGVWSFGPLAGVATGGNVPKIPLVSFPIPLEKALDSEHVHFVLINKKELTLPHFNPEERTPTDCLGTVESPTAVSGNLCIYVRSLSGIEEAILYVIGFEGSPGAAKIGAFTEQLAVTASEPAGSGTWAVTG